MRWGGGNTGGTESKAVLTVLNVKNGKSESPLNRTNEPRGRNYTSPASWRDALTLAF